ncbi:MAG: SHOCT domain-containing protein [Bacteroidales bacterium]
MHYSLEGMGLAMGWWWIIGLIIVVTIVWLVINSMNKKKNPHPGKSPMDILKERYARGEIVKEEFEERKKDLM